jgi:collagenase-like PrtC family protease
MEIGFHLPGFYNNLDINNILIGAMESEPGWFKDNLKIKSVFDTFPTSVWNGGRWVGGQADESRIKYTLKLFNDRGIAVRFTFTNPLICEEHLHDRFCNRVMELSNNGLNEVIVFSPLLEDYIRKNYPKYKITSSTCKQIRSMDELNTELEKDYNLVVLDYNWNNKFDELKKIKHPEKCEVLVNPCCIPNCPRRGEHYANIGRNQIKFWDYMNNPDRSAPFKSEPFECQYMSNTFYDTKGYYTVISPDDVFTKYAEMGFNQFKIEGRSNRNISLLETYMQYLVKPE